MDFKKIPTRTLTHETAVIDIPIDELWPMFREFDLARIFPSYVKFYFNFFSITLYF